VSGMKGLDEIESRLTDMDRPLTTVRTDDLRTLISACRAAGEFAEACERQRAIHHWLEARTKFMRALRPLRDGRLRAMGKAA
jgi:hypothetical protein